MSKPKRKTKEEIISSVVDCFRKGVCVVDYGTRGFTAYAVDLDRRILPMPKPRGPH